MITAAEFLLSHQQGCDAYRLDNIPPWIPPAHGIVFLTALCAVDASRTDGRPGVDGGRLAGHTAC